MADSEQTFEDFLLLYMQNLEKKVVGIVTTDMARYSGYLDGEDTYAAFMNDLKTFGYSFSTRNSTTAKGRIQLVLNSSTAEINVPFFGQPFQTVRNSYADCSQGKYYYKCASEIRSTEELEGVKPPSTKRRRMNIVPSKKIGCRAHMIVRCIRVYDESKYKVDDYPLVKKTNHAAVKQLKEDLLKEPGPSSFLRYYIVISSAEDHNHSRASTNLVQTLHPELRKEIHSLVNQGISSVKDIKLHLDEYVKFMLKDSKLPLPDKENRCYYPTYKIIISHFYCALNKFKMSSADTKALEDCIGEWKTASPEDNFYFRQQSDKDVKVEDGDQSEHDTILFCHQTQWQIEVMYQYANDISLLDPAFKTTKCSVPQYFLYTKTSNGYCIVGTFIIQHESTELISEALSMFLIWNPYWQPKYFMTSLSNAEFGAIEQTFPDARIYISSFHREQLWCQWLMALGNVASGDEAFVRTMWQAIAASCTESSYESNLGQLYSSYLYQENERLREYFTAEWLPHAAKWVEAFWEPDFRTKLSSDDAEAQNVLKHHHFQHFLEKTLTGVVRTIIDEYLPEYFLTQTDPSHVPVKKPAPRFRKKRTKPVKTVVPCLPESAETTGELEETTYIANTLEIDDQTYIIEEEYMEGNAEITEELTENGNEKSNEAAQDDGDLSTLYIQICERLQSLSDLSHMSYVKGDSKHLTECLMSLINLEADMQSDSGCYKVMPEYDGKCEDG